MSNEWQQRSNKALEEALTIQAIPAPTFHEEERAGYVAERFRAFGLTDVAQDDLHNVYGRQPGIEPDLPPLMVSAHTDTVFPASTDLSVQRENGVIKGPGLGDNSMGVAAMLDLAANLEQQPCDIWYVATVGEEGLGDLRGMRRVVERLDLGAAIILEGIGLGKVYNAGLGVRRLRVTVSGQGGHSWLHAERPNAIHHLTQISAAMLDRITLQEEPRSTFNIGLIEGGTSINTRAGYASMAIDMRSTAQTALEALEADVTAAIDAHRGADGLTVTTEVVGDRPSARLSPEHPLVEAAQQILNELGITPDTPKIGSTDANIPLAAGIPSVCIGVTMGGNAHTTEEYIRTGPIHLGLKHLQRLTERAAQNIKTWSVWK